MSPRVRRLVIVAAGLVLLLFAGRWSAGFLAARWWAAAVSPDALANVTRWQLLGLLLDAGAVLTASCWFALQALLVARAIGSVQVERRVGELRVREAVPTRLLVAGAVATGALLGLLTGVGARAWRAPVALAWHGVHYGVDDPLLGIDLGTLVARYPVWQLAHHFAALLVILGLLFAALLYLAIGALRRREGQLDIHPDARRHLGGLLALLAAVIATGYFLAPYRLATSLEVPLSLAAASTRVLATRAAAGAAIAVGAMSLLWALRPRHSLIVAGWAVLALVALGERLIVPAFVAEGAAPGNREERVRQFDGIFYGVSLRERTVSADSLPEVTGLWDSGSLANWALSRRGTLLSATANAGPERPAWRVVTGFAGEPGSIEVSDLAAGALGPGGSPARVAGDSGARGLIRDPRTSPGLAAWRLVGQGVPAGGLLRRIAIAWALQAPGVLGVDGQSQLDWGLDPEERASRLMPGLDWQVDGIATVEGRLVWMVSGLAIVDRAPLATRALLGRREISGAVPAAVATVDVTNGGLRAYLDPSADSLGAAWGGVYAGLIEPVTAMPPELRASLVYSRSLFQVQLTVLSQPEWGLGARAERADAAQPLAMVWDRPGNTPWLQEHLDDPARGIPASILSAGRVGGMAVIVLDQVASRELPGDADLTRGWHRLLPLAQLRDSARAAGDTLLAGPVHRQVTGHGVLAWQVFHSAGRRGTPSVAWIGTARDAILGGGRRVDDAWRSLGAAGSDAAGDRGAAVDAGARLDAVRAWIARADSALERRDMTAFGRAWEAIRGLLAEPRRE